MSIEQYEHHGRQVFVESALKGQHRAHCLCFSCDRFQPTTGPTGSGCAIADAIFATCVRFGVVTPVYECPEWLEHEGQS